MMTASSQRVCGWLLVSLILVVQSGCSGGSKSFKSPQAVFDAAKAKSEKKDFKGFAQCLTPDSQEKLAAMLALSAMMAKAFGGFAAAGGPDAKKAFDEKMSGIDKTLSKHGLSEDVLKKAKPPQMGQGNGEALNEFSTLIKDKPAFIADMMQAMQALGEKEGSSPADTMLGELSDVKITGDSATGKIVTEKAGQSKEEDVNFKKIGGGWLIEIPFEKMGPGGTR